MLYRFIASQQVYYILVPFNDPFTQQGVVTTTDSDVFINAVNALTASGGDDCYEPVLSAVWYALGKMSSFGNLYLFSDAEESDGGRLLDVLVSAKHRQVKIFELLNYGCGSSSQSRKLLIDGTGGQHLKLTGSDIGGGMNLLGYGLRTETTDLLSVVDNSSNTNKSYIFPVDSSLSSITFALSSTDSPGSTVINSFTLTRPDGSVVEPTDPGVAVTSLNIGRLVDISSPASGTWTVSVNMSTSFSLRVYGQSNLDITSVDFVELKGNAGHPGYEPIAGQPIMGQSNKILARVGTQVSSVNFELRSTRNVVIRSFSLSELTETGGVYKQFIGDVLVPETKFLVYLVGTDTTGAPFQRVWPNVFQPQPILVEGPRGYIELVPGQTTTLKYKVSFVSPSVPGDLSLFKVTNSLGYTTTVTPSSGGLSLQSGPATRDVTVAIQTPSNASPGLLDEIVFVAKSNTPLTGDYLYGAHFTQAIVTDVSADTIPPVIVCQSDITATATSAQGAVISYPLPYAEDNRSSITVTCQPPSGSTFPVGDTTVTCTATDATGNSNSCAFKVTVTQNVDTTPPTITCPTNIVTSIPYGQSAGTVYFSVQATDDRLGVTVSCTPASGSSFQRGVTTVTCTATDTSGNQASCSFTISVFDVSIQDNMSKDTLLFNSITGDYIFYRCGTGGFILSGRGSITRQGCLVQLGGDPKVSATLDSCPIAPANRGSATIKPNPIGGWIYLTDSNTTDNTRPCPNG